MTSLFGLAHVFINLILLLDWRRDSCRANINDAHRHLWVSTCLHSGMNCSHHMADFTALQRVCEASQIICFSLVSLIFVDEGLSRKPSAHATGSSSVPNARPSCSDSCISSVRPFLPISFLNTNLPLFSPSLLAPIAWPIAKLLDRVLGADEEHTYKKAELRSFLQFHRQGEEPLRDDEIKILNAVLELNTRSVVEIMTPIKDVVTLSSDAVMDHALVDKLLVDLSFCALDAGVLLIFLIGC